MGFFLIYIFHCMVYIYISSTVTVIRVRNRKRTAQQTLMCCKRYLKKCPLSWDIGRNFNRRIALVITSAAQWGFLTLARDSYSCCTFAALVRNNRTIIASARERLIRPIVDDDTEHNAWTPELRGDYHGWSANLLIEPVLAFSDWSGYATRDALHALRKCDTWFSQCADFMKYWIAQL